MPDVKNKLRIAILDLYEGAPNEGMRCIRELIKQYSAEKNINITAHEFDVRLKQEVPDTSYDIYISTGGPGSPLGEEDYEWEQKYFRWLREIDEYNANKSNQTKKSKHKQLQKCTHTQRLAIFGHYLSVIIAVPFHVGVTLHIMRHTIHLIGTK